MGDTGSDIYILAEVLLVTLSEKETRPSPRLGIPLEVLPRLISIPLSPKVVIMPVGGFWAKRSAFLNLERDSKNLCFLDHSNLLLEQTKQKTSIIRFIKIIFLMALDIFS